MHIGAASSSLPGSASALPAIAPPPRLGHSRLGPSRPRRPSSILAVLARRPTHHPSLAHPRDAGALAPAGYSGWGAKYRRTSSAKSEANAASVCSFLRLLLSIITLLILFVLLSESTETLRATAVHFIRGEGVRLHDTMVCRLGAGPQRGKFTCHPILVLLVFFFELSDHAARCCGAPHWGRGCSLPRGRAS